MGCNRVGARVGARADLHGLLGVRLWLGDRGGGGGGWGMGLETGAVQVCDLREFVSSGDQDAQRKDF